MRSVKRCAAHHLADHARPGRRRRRSGRGPKRLREHTAVTRSKRTDADDVDLAQVPPVSSGPNAITRDRHHSASVVT